jgi:hypothetical protein
MLATILKSPVATQTTLLIIETFAIDSVNVDTDVNTAIKAIEA